MGTVPGREDGRVVVVRVGEDCVVLSLVCCVEERRDEDSCCSSVSFDGWPPGWSSEGGVLIALLSSLLLRM